MTTRGLGNFCGSSYCGHCKKSRGLSFTEPGPKDRSKDEKNPSGKSKSRRDKVEGQR